MNYEPNCGDCPTVKECKEKSDCQVMRQIRHGNRWGVPQGEPTKAWAILRALIPAQRQDKAVQCPRCYAMVTKSCGPNCAWDWEKTDG